MAASSITVIQRIEEIKTVADFWRSRQNHPDADIDFFLNDRLMPDFIRPHITVLRSDGKLKCLVLGAIWERLFEYKIGYQKLFSLKSRFIDIPHGGVLGKLGAFDGLRIVRSLVRSIGRGDADAVYIKYINPDSPLSKAARTVPQWPCRDFTIEPAAHYRIQIPPTLEQIFDSWPSNMRRNMRKTKRRLEKRFSGRLRIVYNTDVKDIDSAMADIESVACRTYQRALGVGFQKTSETKRKWQVAASNGNLLAAVLYVDGRAWAFNTGFICGDVFVGMSTGYDPTKRKYEPGRYLFLKLIEYLCNEARVETFDLGFGDAYYKKAIATESIEQNIQFIFAPTIRGLGLNSLKILSEGINGWSVKLLKRLDLLDKIRTGWRKQLVMNKLINN